MWQIVTQGQGVPQWLQSVVRTVSGILPSGRGEGGGGGGMRPAPISPHPCPFLEPHPSIGSGAYRPLTTLCPSSPCPLSFPPYSPFLSLGRLCQPSPRSVPVSCSVLGPRRGGQRPLPFGEGEEEEELPAVGLGLVPAGRWER